MSPSGGGGGSNFNDVAAAAPDREPERNESTSQEFDMVANDNYQDTLAEEIARLQANEHKPQLGLDHTIGGSIEQAVHTESFKDWSAEVKELQERQEQHQNSRTR